jgi:hypothetical protein
MLINLFLRNPLHFKDIEKYQYGMLFSVASYSIYTIKYSTDYTFIINLMFCFLSGETFFLPYSRIDTIIHHLLGIGFIYYPTIYSIPLKQIEPHIATFLKVETSSLFLASSYFLKERLKTEKNNKYIQYLSTTSNVLLIATFFKYRIYDFMSNIFLNTDFYNDMILRSNTSSSIYIYSTSSMFFLLNSYWLSKMLKIVYKMIK